MDTQTENREARVRVNVEQGHKDRMEKVAKALGFSLSTWANSRLLEAMTQDEAKAKSMGLL